MVEMYGLPAIRAFAFVGAIGSWRIQMDEQELHSSVRGNFEKLAGGGRAAVGAVLCRRNAQVNSHEKVFRASLKH